MYGSTVEDIIRSVLGKVHEIPGIGTQTYSEDLIADKLLEIVHDILDEYDIPWYQVRKTITIDGVNGYAEEDISTVTSVTDILHLYRQGTDEQIFIAPSNYNVLRATGATTQFIQPIPFDPDVGKCFHTWPKTAVDTLELFATARPITLSPTTVVYFDKNMLADGVAAKIVEGDASNPGWAGNLLEMYSSRLTRMYQNYKKLQTDKRGPNVNSWPVQYYVNE